MSTATERIAGFFRGGGPLRFILPGIAAFLLIGNLFSGGFGVIEVEPGEVAVIYNTTGIDLFGEEKRVVHQQGTITFMPWFQTVEILHVEPLVLVMEGEKDIDANHVRKLTVRANDGSNFWFNKLEIHYQAIPAKADVILEAHGRDDAYKNNALRVHARAVLRDEFGQYSFLQAADPSSYGKAVTDARTVLNERLRPTGIEVTQVITPKPSFAANVEKAIADRQNAEQEVLVLAKQRERLDKQADRLRQQVTEEKNAEYQALLAQLASDLQQAKNKAVSVKREADKYSIDRLANGHAIHTEKTTRAKASAVAARERAQGLAAQIRAVGDQGPDVLNAEIAHNIFPQLQKLRAKPYANASQPIDIRHISATGNDDGGQP